MKCLTLIFHTDVQQDVTDELHNLKQVSGFTFSHVEGHGIETESDGYLSARDKSVGYTTRVRLDILVDEDDLDSVLASLRKTIPDVKDQGIYWVTAVEQNGRL